MKLKEISIENFRGYKSMVTVTFEDLTAFVGKNDIGKSTILEALDIFFNDGKGLIKLNHNELYGFIQSKAILEDSNNEREKHFEQWLINKGCQQTKLWIRIYGGTPQPAQACTLSTYIRNYIHHPENKLNLTYTTEELAHSVATMKNIAQNLL